MLPPGTFFKREFGQHVGDGLSVFLLKHPGVLAVLIVAAVVPVFGHLIDEEQRKHLYTLGKKLPFLLEMRSDRFADLDAAAAAFGQVAISLAGLDVDAIGQLHRFGGGVDLFHDYIAIELKSVGGGKVCAYRVMS